MKTELERLAKTYPGVVKNARGLGFMLGLELAENIPAFAGSDKSPAVQFVNRLHAAGVLTIPAGTQIIRLLPPLNLKPHGSRRRHFQNRGSRQIARVNPP